MTVRLEHANVEVVDVDGMVRFLKTAFDEDSGRYSPGHVLLDYAYRRYAESGMIKKMCLITDYDWVSNWNPRYLEYLDMRAFKKTLRGRVASAAYSALRKN